MFVSLVNCKHLGYTMQYHNNIKTSPRAINLRRLSPDILVGISTYPVQSPDKKSCEISVRFREVNCEVMRLTYSFASSN